MKTISAKKRIDVSSMIASTIRKSILENLSDDKDFELNPSDSFFLELNNSLKLARECLNTGNIKMFNRLTDILDKCIKLAEIKAEK